MKRKGYTFVELLVTILVVVVMFSLLIPALRKVRTQTYIPACRNNLKHLGKIIQQYATDHDGSYPTADKWCDLLVQRYKVPEKSFVCPSGEKELPCYYAINPNAEPHSSSDTVLLFETKGGWNKFGGLEIVSTENHQFKDDPEGCNVLFNNGRVRYIKTKRLDKLNWGDKQKQ